MPTRRGIVTEAAIDVLAARLSADLPGLGEAEVRRIARAQADELRECGWRITAPVSVLATTQRRRKAERST